MSVSLDQVIRDARTLSSAERAELLSQLIQDLDAVYAEPLEELDSFWKKELGRRIEEIDSGKVKCIPAEEVFDRLRPRSDETN
jgi:putative addiction module component (TIGR02574 family)